MNENIDPTIKLIQSTIADYHQKNDIVSICARDHVTMSALILANNLKLEIVSKFSCKPIHSDKIIDHLRRKGININQYSQNNQSNILVLVSKEDQ